MTDPTPHDAEIEIALREPAPPDLPDRLSAERLWRAAASRRQPCVLATHASRRTPQGSWPVLQLLARPAPVHTQSADRDQPWPQV